MTYRAEYRDVYLPLIIGGCSIAELCCDVMLEEDFDDFVCREIRVYSDILGGDEYVTLKRGDTETRQMFEALEKQACEDLSEQYCADLTSSDLSRTLSVFARKEVA